MLLAARPVASRAQTAVIDACDYPDDTAARKAWVAGEGSTLAAARVVDGEPALLLRCNFAASSAGRGVWDRKVAIDLEQAEGIQFEIRCANAGPVSSFTLYLKTGDGWRSGTFSPRRSDGWETITLPKSEMREEGKPGGWDGITGLRLAAWKGDDEDTEFLVRDVRRVGILGEDAHILVVRGDPGAPGDKRGEADLYARHVSGLLAELGLRHATVAEPALTAEALAKAQLVILPHNPNLAGEAASRIIDYLRGGGKLLVFYSMPRALEAAAGIEGGKFLKSSQAGQFSAIRPIEHSLEGAPAETKQASWNIVAFKAEPGRHQVLAEWFDASGKDTGFPAVVASANTVFMTHVLLEDDHANKARLLLSLVGHHAPEFWKEVIARRRESFADAAAGKGARMAGVLRLPQRDKIQASLRKAQSLVEQADAAESRGQFGEVINALDAAAATELEAYCLAKAPKAGEFRAVWCHSAFGVKGLSWDATIAGLKKNGFTAMMPNMLWGGVAYYPSEVLPVSAEVAKRGDQMAECVAACREHGLEIHVWKVDWNLGHEVPVSFVDKMRAEHRLQRSVGGEEQPWLCPSNPVNQELERDALAEVARKYPIDGIHFDYIRYPGPDHCFCPPCRERFEKASGKAVQAWPGDVLPKGSRREEWIRWCQDNITATVKATSEAVRRVRPGTKISAAVFRNWEVDSRVVMQDWKMWCARGYLDFVCPMDYTSNPATYDRLLRKQKEWAGPALLCPGIGVSASHPALAPEDVIRQIELTRKHGAMGFIIFNYGEKEARDLVPLLGLGITRP